MHGWSVLDRQLSLRSSWHPPAGPDCRSPFTSPSGDPLLTLPDWDVQSRERTLRKRERSFTLVKRQLQFEYCSLGRLRPMGVGGVVGRCEVGGGLVRRGLVGCPQGGHKVDDAFGVLVARFDVTPIVCWGS